MKGGGGESMNTASVNETEAGAIEQPSAKVICF